MTLSRRCGHVLYMRQLLNRVDEFTPRLVRAPLTGLPLVDAACRYLPVRPFLARVGASA